MPEKPPPGWYPDPFEPNSKRWWNGEHWQGYEPAAESRTQSSVTFSPKQETTKPVVPDHVRESSEERHFKVSADKSSYVPKGLFTALNVLLVAAFIGLGVLAFNFSKQSTANLDAASRWEKTAGKWKGQSQDLKARLAESEADVSGLEKRQARIANEKAKAEDERNYLATVAAELVAVGDLQQQCADGMDGLLDAVLNASWDWALANVNPITRDCRRATEQYQGILTELGV